MLKLVLSRPLLHFTALCAVLLARSHSLRADSITGTIALETVSQFSGNWNSPPSVTTGGETTDAPLLGNGNLGVAFLGSIDSMTCLLGKNEFWSLANGGQYPMANMSIAISGMSGASYAMSEVIADGQVTGSFTNSGNTVKLTSWVQATDTTNNLFITEFAYSGATSNTVTISFAQPGGNSFPADSGTSGNVIYLDVNGDSNTSYEGYATAQVRCTATVIGATPSISSNQLTFTMQPGNTYTVVACIMSNYDSSSWQSAAISNISSLTAANITTDESNHEAWWDSFWEKSFLILPDQVLEQQYYGSAYVLACCSTPNHMPPGLWGNWPLGNTAWGGDDHLNYDYEVPFLFALTINQPQLAASYSTPVLNWMPNGESAASANGYSGVYYPVGIGPLPNGSIGSASFLNQKSDATYAAVDMIAYYYSTQNSAYASQIMPYLANVATFWQSYLTWDGTYYDDTNDAQQENDSYPQTNGTMSLGLIHYLLQGAITISTALNVDASQRATWTTINNELAPYATFTYNGVTCFRETSVGRSWDTGNDCECQMIYPANGVGLLSSASLLSTALNTVNQYGAQGAWTDVNATPTFYPCAARVGVPAATIISNLHNWVTGNSYNNMQIHSAGGGMENLNTVPACLTEMMLQSFQGTVVIFPDYASQAYGKFGDLVANGNFLVSSEIDNGTIQYVRCTSQSGGTFTFQNPWPGQTIALYLNGNADGTLSGTDISLSTSAGNVYVMGPNGTSYATLISAMEALPGTSGLFQINASYNVSGIYTDGTSFSSGGFDGVGYAYSLSQLGASVNWSGSTFQFGPANQANGVSNTSFLLPPGQYPNINLVGAAVNGNQTSQTFTVYYTDGTSSTFTQNFSDWCTPQSYAGESEAVTMTYRDAFNGGSQSIPCYLYGYNGFNLNSSKTLEYITLPANRNVVIAGVQLYTANTSIGAAYNDYAMYTNGTSFSTGIDGSGSGAHALSATLLGSSTTWNGTTLTYGAANGKNGVSRQTFNLPWGKYSNLNMLALAVNGSQSSQNFTVVYADGTFQTFNQGISDWGAPQNYSGEAKAVTMSYRVTATGGTQSGTFYVYGYTFPLNNAKTATQLILPSDNSVVVLSVAGH